MPPAHLTTTAFVGEALAVVERLRAAGLQTTCEVTSGEALRDRGYGMLWGVGKAAEEPPALVVLSHTPEGASESVCLVGKGIVYDTGGLSLKSKDGMPGMKSDCGGAAALLAAFEAAVSIGNGGQALEVELGGDSEGPFPQEETYGSALLRFASARSAAANMAQPRRPLALHLVLCLAENAIGNGALRNDDILRCLSGKTCEINNTDAEGRLVLADGVAHASASPPRLPGAARQPDLIVDMATLTGAQMIATGKRHAAILANSEELELAAVAAGKRSGELVHPLPYAPEFHMAEFASKVADMKNSVKDRGNAQASCAGTFIGEHLHPEYQGGWLHVDIAGPSFIAERGTGYGVGFTLALLGVHGFD